MTVFWDGADGAEPADDVTQRGGVGGVKVLAALTLIGEQARDRSGILILAGIAGLIFSHVLVNVGMALGIVPPIGIPLPLLSYGGSATLTTFVSLGLSLNVGCRRFVYS